MGPHTNPIPAGQALDGSLELTPAEPKVWFAVHRSGDARVTRRTHVLLLLDDGLSYRDVRAFLDASHDLIADCVRRFRQGGLHEALESKGSPPTPPDGAWLPTVKDWLQDATPQAFG